MANLSYYNYMCPMGAWSATYPYTTQVLYNELGVGGVLQCPVVSYNGNMYVANGFTTAGIPKQPTLNVIPPSDNAWIPYTQIPIIPTNPSSRLLSTILNGASIEATTVESVIPISTIIYFNNEIIGTGITVNNDNTVSLAQGQIWNVLITAQAINFTTTADELQVYYAIAINSDNYIDAPPGMRVSSIAVGTVGSNVPSVASSREFIFDTTSTGYNDPISLQFKSAIIGGTLQSCFITSNVQFGISIYNQGITL